MKTASHHFDENFWKNESFRNKNFDCFWMRNASGGEKQLYQDTGDYHGWRFTAGIKLMVVFGFLGVIFDYLKTKKSSGAHARI